MPFSVWADPGAPVAAPISWKGMDTINNPNNFHIGADAELVKQSGSKALGGWSRAGHTSPDL